MACSYTGYAIFVDRGVWNKLDEEVQDACVDAGLITLKGAAAASVALTVRSIGEAPPVPRKRAAPKSRKPAKKGKLSAVVRAKRGVTWTGFCFADYEERRTLEIITTVLSRKEIRLES